MTPPAAPRLYAHLRLAQLFGANTDVGKTVLATALCRASARAGERPYYLKPVSTGPGAEADERHLARYAPQTRAATLHQWALAASPHLAAAQSSKAVPSDAELVAQIAAHIGSVASSSGSEASSSAQQHSALYIETAGGVHSPTPAGGSTAHALRPLRMPTLLIGDSNLGGISTTLSAYDSLLLAGHDVRAILLFADRLNAPVRWGNAEYLRRWGEEHGVPVFSVAGPDATGSLGPPPPKRAGDEQEMEAFYEGLAGSSEAGEVIKLLRREHEQKLAELASMGQRTLDHCWWPFTQHTLAKTPQDVNVIDSASGDFFSVFTAERSSPAQPPPSPASSLQPVLDGSASWWTQCLGHSDPGVTRAAARAAARYGHVLFPMSTNAPVLRLTEAVLGISQGEKGSDLAPILPAAHAPGHGWASRVFFSDDGSTGMEVALKMAIASAALHYAGPRVPEAVQQRTTRGREAGSAGGRAERTWEVIGLKGSYHGDTIGTMDACEPSTYSAAVHWYKGRGAWLDPPSVAVHDGRALVTQPSGETQEYASIADIYDVEIRLGEDPLAASYAAQIRRWLEDLTVTQGRRFGALVIEPLILGAGGMVFVDPLFQRVLVDTVRESEDLFSLVDPPMRSQRRVQPREGPRDPSEWRGLPVVYDEVFTGLWRLGQSAPARVIGATPDISVLAKILTGGLVPMALTLASQSIFATFARSEEKVDALLHGHSYTAHPVGCEVAAEALRRISRLDTTDETWRAARQDWRAPEAGSREAQGKVAPWSFWQQSVVDRLSRSDAVSSAMAMGTVLVVNLRDSNGGGYTSTASVELLQQLRNALPAESGSDLRFDIHARPLGNVVYLMSSLNTPSEVRRATEQMLCAALNA